MKATTALTLMAAWIWIFQGCDIKSHKTQFAVNPAQNNVNKSACYESYKQQKLIKPHKVIASHAVNYNQ